MSAVRRGGAAKRAFVARLLAAQGGRCHWCGVPLWAERPMWFDDPGEWAVYHKPTVDHVVPRAAGGGDRCANLVIACYACNHRRGASPDPPTRPRLAPHAATTELLADWPPDQPIRCECGGVFWSLVRFHRHSRARGHAPAAGDGRRADGPAEGGPASGSGARDAD